MDLFKIRITLKNNLNCEQFNIGDDCDSKFMSRVVELIFRKFILKHINREGVILCQMITKRI